MSISCDDGDPTTEKAMIQGLGLAGVKAVIEGLREMTGEGDRACGADKECGAMR